MFAHRTALIATMHEKEKIIAPFMQKALGLNCITLQGFDTDAFGTFTGEIERPASQLETLRIKCMKGLEMSNLDICIASEGAFGAHPTLSFLPADVEMVMLIDRKNNLEVVGEVLSTETNFSKQEVQSWDEAWQFALQAGFPSHGLVVGFYKNDTFASALTPSQGRENITNPFPQSKLEIVAKGVKEEKEFENVVKNLLEKYQVVHLETDMRAMHNPTRQKVIAEATEALIKKLLSACPQCATVGFSPVEFRLGLPCENCGLPTQEILAAIWECKKCGYTKEEMYPQGKQEASAARCYFCNP